MVYVCCYLGCKINSRNLIKSNPSNISFIAFPKYKKVWSRDKCLRWAAASQTQENVDSFIEKINRNTYICTKHFAGGGPSKEHPDPIKVCISRFKTDPTSTELYQIRSPIGWSTEQLENDSYRFCKKRREAVIIQCDILADLKYTVDILGLPPEQWVEDELPTVEKFEDTIKLLNHLDSLVICAGNAEDRFIEAFYRMKNSTKGTHDETRRAIYSVNCKRVSKLTRCSSCIFYRNTLRGVLSHTKNKTKKIKLEPGEIEPSVPFIVKLEPGESDSSVSS